MILSFYIYNDRRINHTNTFANSCHVFIISYCLTIPVFLSLFLPLSLFLSFTHPISPSFFFSRRFFHSLSLSPWFSNILILKDAMLREYQDEIKRLKDQLDATQRGVIIGEDGKVLLLRRLYFHIYPYSLSFPPSFLFTNIFSSIPFYFPFFLPTSLPNLPSVPHLFTFLPIFLYKTFHFVSPCTCYIGFLYSFPLILIIL